MADNIFNNDNEYLDNNIEPNHDTYDLDNIDASSEAINPEETLQTFEDISLFSASNMNNYVKLSDKYEDIKSSAATMLIVGGAGLILMALILAKVIVLPLSPETSWLFYSVMGGVFIIFVISGIISFMHAKQVKIDAVEEDKLIDSINLWISENLIPDSIDSGLDLNQPEEILYFTRAERIKHALMVEFENVDEPLIDELTEQCYQKLYEL